MGLRPRLRYQQNQILNLMKYSENCYQNFYVATHFDWMEIHLVDSMLLFYATQENIWKFRLGPGACFSKSQETWLYVIGYSCHNNELMTNNPDCPSCLRFQSRLPISKHFETPGKEYFTKHNSYQIFLNKLHFSWIVIYNTLLKIWMIWQLQWVEGKETHTPDLKLHFSPKIFPKKPISTLCFN